MTEADEMAQSIMSTIGLIQKSFIALAVEADRALANMEVQGRRAQLLAAYKTRHRWKKSDLAHLKTLGVNAAARARMARVEGRGRPVVKPYQPPLLSLLRGVEAVQPLFSPSARERERRQALRKWPWWEHHVEALYRGEHELAEREHRPAPADYAERRVANALGLSQSTVHTICGNIRAIRLDWEGRANFPPMLLLEFGHWMRTGECRGIQ